MVVINVIFLCLAEVSHLQWLLSFLFVAEVSQAAASSFQQCVDILETSVQNEHASLSTSLCSSTLRLWRGGENGWKRGERNGFWKLENESWRLCNQGLWRGQKELKEGQITNKTTVIVRRIREWTWRGGENGIWRREVIMKIKKKMGERILKRTGNWITKKREGIVKKKREW